MMQLGMNEHIWDPKGDPAMSATLHSMMERGKLLRAECVRRGVTFLPAQVMRPVYKKAGLSVGPILKAPSLDMLFIGQQE